ncbi:MULTISPECIES: DUF305 domain-containing protein [Hymenobacter]|uniref:Uncharacterized conserved protein, DUF305 family n=1 Tax=Hymenobacter psychrotolerans DSM 18569 TaxID=1121959 RepID=A0A1M7A062_9BACT|nr:MULTISPECIES: DUF305 domain-containing protein [Hymenobacter]QNE42057.1 DUF305 domain-containing protein [Hymenobacter sp. NBH84]SHL36152.1 Uncharacterized conserved protein, DUF305 family [Hymenobacter psychrotolerans DSM 18569]
MKTSAFLLATLCSGTLLLGSCSSDNKADTTATETTTNPAADDMAGMDHSKMSEGAAGSSPLTASMNNMMSKMEAMPMKGNTDHDFAHMMLEHHKGAVAMADIELRDGKDATMRQMAEKIKADQQQEISELEAIAQRLDSAPTNYKPKDPADPFTAQMKTSMDHMMQNMPAPVADADMNFNMLMTVHHQSAMDMAEAELAHGKDTKLKEMAQKMVDAQKMEIEQFKAWHAKNADKM